MIIDTMENLPQYAGISPLFTKALQYLSGQDLRQLPLRRQSIQGDDIYMTVMEVEAHPQEGAKLEYHRRYIDLQMVLSGQEIMGWTATADLPADTPFDTEKDYALLTAPVSAWFPVAPGRFAIFFPGDAHAPCCGQGKIRKAVMKIRCQ